jgi:hypothetical protein
MRQAELGSGLAYLANEPDILPAGVRDMADDGERREEIIRLRRSRRVLIDLLWLRERQHALVTSALAAENARLRRRLRRLSAEHRQKTEGSR